MCCVCTYVAVAALSKRCSLLLFLLSFYMPICTRMVSVNYHLKIPYFVHPKILDGLLTLMMYWYILLATHTMCTVVMSALLELNLELQ